MIPKIKSSPTFNISILCLLVFLLTNCDQSLNETKKFDLETANSEIELRLRAYEVALENGNTTALGSIYTEDAEILHDGRPAGINIWPKNEAHTHFYLHLSDML